MILRLLLDVRMEARVEKIMESEKAHAAQNLESKAEKALALEAPKLMELPAPSSSRSSEGEPGR